MPKTMYQQVRDQLKAHRGKLTEIAAEADIPHNTITRIDRGETVSPSVHVIEKLHRCFQRRANRKGREATRSESSAI